jgi:hypothetical protein
MNLLALVQRLAQECGVSGTIATVVGLTGEQLRLLNWVQEGWNELQAKHDDWWFLRSSVLTGGGVSYVPVAGIAYTPLGTGAGTVGVTEANFGAWDLDSARVNTTTATYLDETRLDKVSFDYWREVYMFGANRSVQTRPCAIAEGPNKQLCVGPPSNGLYTVTCDYFTAPTIMSADTDVPTGLPAKFHMAIVYKAMTFYGAYESASEVFKRGEDGWDTMIAQLEVKHAPEISFAGALDA